MVLGEENHYKIIDANLTLESIYSRFGFSPDNYNTELIDHPAQMLNDIYGLVGKSYGKKQNQLKEQEMCWISPIFILN